MLKFLVPLACGILVCVLPFLGAGAPPDVSAHALPTPQGLSIGTLNSMTGGQLCKNFSYSALTPGAGSIVGAIQNGLGNKMTDCKVAILAVGTGNPPTLTGGTIGTTSVSSGGTANFNPPVDNGGSGNVSIDTAAASGTACTEFKICFNPSSTNNAAGGECDQLAAFDLSSQATKGTDYLDFSGNSGVRAYVRNQNSGDRPQRLVSFSGTYAFPSGQTNSITHVYVTRSLDDGPMSGVTATVTSSTTFTVTGLSLTASQSIMLDVTFEATPNGASNLSVEGSFRE